MGKSKANNSFGNLEKAIVENKDKIIITLVSLLLIVFLLNGFFISNSNNLLNKKIKELREFNEPVNISLSVITCNGCSNVSSVIENIKSQNVNILKLNYFNFSSDNAKILIAKYGIKKLPSIIINGKINSSKVKFSNFKSKDNVLIFNGVKAPYLDIVSGDLMGKVKIIEIVDSSCEKCVSLSSIPINFKKGGVLITEWDTVEYNSTLGRKLIKEFGVKEIPTLLISEGIDYYPNIKKGLDNLGLNEKQGFYVLHAVQPPYRNLSENKIVGLVNLITLTDKSCPSCYNVNVNKQILERLGVVIKSESDYDINSPEGKALISKYDIQKVPMIILSPGAKEYSSFVNAWKPVGNVGNDGWFVMRNPQALGTVKDIINGTIIEAKK